MNPIGAGTLGRRIKIQRPSTVKDSLGAPSRTWIDVATVWAGAFEWDSEEMLEEIRNPTPSEL